jgi:penicillin G amidase
MKFIRFIFVVTLTLALIYGLDNRWVIKSQRLKNPLPLPPLGKLLDPFTGFWHNAEPFKKPNMPTQLQLEGMKGRATIVYDDKLVPHIFAENDEDIYFLQGYVTAQHRLWQMEFQTHAAAGRVSEIVGDIAGEAALNLDREARRTGMVYGAQNALAGFDSIPEAKATADAYTKGVNTYIKSLKYRDFPLEYKILDYAPEEWTILKSGLLLKQMSKTLSFREADFEMANALRLFGKEFLDVLYPEILPEQAPIVNQPNEWKFKPVEVQTPALSSNIIGEYIKEHYKSKENDGVGSNNWAVAASKTASGNAILCDDPHLALSMPSIWYEMQMQTPTMNVYGVTLPGAPCVIIGFTDSISWGVTNAQRDLVDWYQVKFKDDSKNEYLLDGKDVKTKKVVEVIKVRNKPDFIDTVSYTTWGPVTYDDKFGAKNQKIPFALRWIAHDVSTDLMTFYKLNRGKNYQDYLEAMKYYVAPAQNFAFASVKGEVAMWIQGKYPAKWKGQGKFPLDGTQSSQRWQTFIPQEQNVYQYNPSRGYVSSANQHPADSTYPYYVNAANFEYYRNRRINSVLDSMKNITVEDMKRLQGDNYNLQASESLPYFLAQLNQQALTPEGKDMFKMLSEWNFYNDPMLSAPIYYEVWWRKLKPLLWDEMQKKDISLDMPDNFNSIKLLKEKPTFEFMDIKATPEKETAKELIQISFKQALDSIANWRKENSNKPLQWAYFKNTTIRHLSRSFKPFDRIALNGGNAGIVNATSAANGPSWRMIVEMDKNGVKGYGVYPGGQSGNAGSPYYDSMVDYWERGEYYPLLFLKSPSEKHKRIITSQMIEPKK